MKNLTTFVLMLALLTLTTLPVMAQEDDPCLPEGYRTQTQGGWSNDCHGNNPGCIRAMTIGYRVSKRLDQSVATSRYISALRLP